LLVARELSIEFGELDIDGFNVRVDLEMVSAERYNLSWTVVGRRVHFTFCMAPLNVGLGAVFFAPKSRFIAITTL
jgi:hypothetical protein